MEARDLHLSKYITKYQALYPTSQILLIKCPAKHVIIRSQGAASVLPAVAIIKNALLPSTTSNSHDAGEEENPEVLVHLFSNGGSGVLNWLYTAFAASGATFPSHNTIFDSAPGEWSYWTSFTAISTCFRAGWARTVASPFVHLLCVTYWALYIPWGRVNPLERDRLGHNDVTRVREGRRAYVYSDRDELVLAASVESHAADAVRKGFEVRLEKFRGSAHVAHMVRDPERYWGVVRETWEMVKVNSL